jgi:hypothetical protein
VPHPTQIFESSGGADGAAGLRLALADIYLYYGAQNAFRSDFYIALRRCADVAAERHRTGAGARHARELLRLRSSAWGICSPSTRRSQN